MAVPTVDLQASGQYQNPSFMRGFFASVYCPVRGNELVGKLRALRAADVVMEKPKVDWVLPDPRVGLHKDISSQIEN